ncbi:multiple antibiotic resistance protein MarB [Klebsiella indica]|uniref:Multiple antibiotic resistance protein MarB n=1 Tax=Klebsiella indica TaxID=2582917 RepID=A0A5R9LD08_9ENTR|nr:MULTISPECIES: multiple antibiotic resistance protein MarB [Klebsiella]TLV08830.1 multiple antibiotic resistance protein MarB [Klebsiella indica]
MKLFVAVATLLVALVSGEGYAEQTTTPVHHTKRDAMMMPSEEHHSPFDFNHMASGSDKSDELGVAYYNQQSH